jgi:opacity protein-like surface antigen
MTRNTLAATTCGVLLSALTLLPEAARAADLLPPPVPSQSGMSCLYARLNGGGTFYDEININQNILDINSGAGFGPNFQSNALNEDLSETGFIEGGFGCQVNDLLRVEATGGYHFKASLTDGYYTLSADYDNITVFANAFWDITNYGGFTPYVGGGVGLAINTLSNVSDPVGAADSTNTSFAWNIAAGMSYDISNNWKVDLAWRYTSFGELVSGGRQPFDSNELGANEVVLSLRYNFWSW